jgi:hypothetical protein
MGFTSDGQITPEFVAKRDELFRVNSTETRESRANISKPEALPGADSWKMGFVLTYGIINTTTNTTSS